MPENKTIPKPEAPPKASVPQAPAAAPKPPERAQKCVDRHIKKLGKKLQCFGIGHGFAVFPTAHRLPGDKHLFRQLLLRKTLFRPKLQNDILSFHIPYRLICDTAIVSLGLLLYKQPAVAVSSTYWNLTN